MGSVNIDDNTGRAAVQAALKLLKNADLNSSDLEHPTEIPELWTRSSLADWGNRQDFFTITTAVRYLLQLTRTAFPGKAVELRVPPAGAVQILAGVNHRRGTPPAVVELAPVPWIGLACGLISWEQLLATPLLRASGEQADLRKLFPLSLEIPR